MFGDAHDHHRRHDQQRNPANQAPPQALSRETIAHKTRPSRARVNFLGGNGFDGGKFPGYALSSSDPRRVIGTAAAAPSQSNIVRRIVGWRDADREPFGTARSRAAARYTTEYPIDRRLGGHPTPPDASAHAIAPHSPVGLRLRDTSIVACLVAVRAFYQTRRKPKSLALRRFLGLRERHRCRRRQAKHRQNKRHFLAIQHDVSFLVAVDICSGGIEPNTQFLKHL